MGRKTTKFVGLTPKTRSNVFCSCFWCIAHFVHVFRACLRHFMMRNYMFNVLFVFTKCIIFLISFCLNNIYMCMRCIKPNYTIVQRQSKLAPPWMCLSFTFLKITTMYVLIMYILFIITMYVFIMYGFITIM